MPMADFCEAALRLLAAPPAAGTGGSRTARTSCTLNVAGAGGSATDRDGAEIDKLLHDWARGLACGESTLASVVPAARIRQDTHGFDHRRGTRRPLARHPGRRRQQGLLPGWLERTLVLNRCEDCGRWHHPPKPVCPECWSDRVRPTPVSGRGTVHLLIWLRQGPPADGVDYATPHPVVTVELEEQTGLRFTSTVVDAAMDELAIGDSGGTDLDRAERASRSPPSPALPPPPLPADATLSRKAPPAWRATRSRTRSRSSAWDRPASPGTATAPGTPWWPRRASPPSGTPALSKQDVDGVSGTLPSAHRVVSMLGLPEVTHYVNQPPPFVFTVEDAMNAIFAGSADVVLAYHAMFRSPAVSVRRRVTRCAATSDGREHLPAATGDSTPSRSRDQSATPPGPADTCTSTAFDASTSATSRSTTAPTRRPIRWPPCGNR